MRISLFIIRATIKEERLEMSGNRGSKEAQLTIFAPWRIVVLPNSSIHCFTGEGCAGFVHGADVEEIHFHPRSRIRTLLTVDSRPRIIPFPPFQIPSKHHTTYSQAPNCGAPRKAVGCTTDFSLDRGCVIRFATSESSSRERNPFSRSFASP